MKNVENIANFIFEIGMLKRESHSGLKLAGIKHPPSVAEHVFRASQIGYLLAVLEGVNPERVACMVMFHDNHETRLRDLHRVVSRYIPRDVKKRAEREAEKEQISGLGMEIEKRISGYLNETGTKECQIAKEADELEQAFTAKEFQNS